MTPNGYALLGLTALVGALIAIVTFALLRFADAARNTRRLRSDRGELALMSAALQEAVTKLKAQERATAARAEASERLSEEIIASLTAGLLVSGLDGEIRILNPAGRRMLGISDTASADEIRTALADLALGEVLRESFTTTRRSRDARSRFANRDRVCRNSASPCRRSPTRSHASTARSACSPI
jgi:nitrogen fixation/metabolism regulation signal transduction histidine kinase